MKNLRKVSNYSIAGILALGVLVLSFFAYQSKIQADTILPGYATAHVGLNITVPDARAVPFTVRFTPTDGSQTYYFKSRSFSFAVPGLNTVEWYIRKIPQGTYKVTVFSSDTELYGSPVESLLTVDQVNQTSEFELNLGEPIEEETPVENVGGETIEQTPVPEETVEYESPTATASQESENPYSPGEPLETF